MFERILRWLTPAQLSVFSQSSSACPTGHLATAYLIP